jgi:predicted metal-dependent enzyme (double-stranded beta helix superfamily)
MFDVDQFLADCRVARDETSPHLAIRDVLDRALDEPDEVAEALAPTEGGLTLLRHEPDLTVVHAVWAPGMRLFPHDHRMWAAIGIYAGQEDNAFYRRTRDERSTLSDAGGIAVRVGDVLMLGDDVIHSVENPTRKLTGAIHVYGGDFVNQPRSQWGPGPVEERPFDMAEAERHFAEANEAWRASG